MPAAVQRVALYARVSTNDKDQNPETQLQPLRVHVAGLTRSTERAERTAKNPAVIVLGEFVDRAAADHLTRAEAAKKLRVRKAAFLAALASQHVTPDTRVASQDTHAAT